jgi:hypothetical protein
MESSMRFQKTAALKPLARNLVPLFVAIALLMTISVSTSTAEVAATDEYDWQGTWGLQYKSQIKGRRFPWDFTFIRDTFDARFEFSVDANGKVKGKAYAWIYYGSSYDGCASEIASTHVCTLRCKGNGGTDLPDSIELSVSGQVKGQTVHLRLNPPADLVGFDISSTCVGEVGTQNISQKMSWFCGAGSQVCAASAHFLQIDMPLVSKSTKIIHYPEADGGEEGWVSIRRNCRNMPDGKVGFLYVKSVTASLHQDPSVNSPTVGSSPNGSRLVFRNTMQKNGMRWYYLAPPGSTPGWVPSSDLTCERSPLLARGKKIRLRDTGLENSHPTPSMSTGANG